MALLDLFDLFRFERNRNGPPLEGRDGKEFRKSIRTKSDEVYDVLRDFVPSFYTSDIVGPNWTQLLKAYSVEIAKIQCQQDMIRDDHIFDTTRSEFLYQNIGYFLFINQQIDLSTFSDEEFRDFLLAIIDIFFGGSTPENIVRGIKLFLGEDINVVLRENYIDARDPTSGFDISDQFGFRIDFEITDEIARNFSDIFQKIFALVTIIKPAHTLFQLRSIFSDNVDAGNLIRDEFRFEIFDYFYEDIRKYCQGVAGRDRLGHKVQQCIVGEDASDQFGEAELTIIDGSAFIEAFGFLNDESVPATDGAGDLIGDAALDGAGNAIFSAFGNLFGNGALTGEGGIIFASSGALDGSAIIDGSGSLILGASGSLEGNGFLTGTGIVFAGSAPAPTTYFSMDNVDISGLTILDGMGLNDATNINSIPGAVGQVGQALDLDGTSSYIRISADVSLESHIGPSGTLSFFAWVNPDTLAGTQTVASKWDSTNDERAWRLDLTATGAVQVTVSDQDGTNSASVVSSLLVATGAFTQVGFVYDATQVAVTDKVTIIVNGVDDVGATAGPASGSFTAMSSTQTDVLLGANNLPAVADHFDGRIDEVTFYQSALISVQYIEVFNLVDGGSRVVDSIPLPTSLWTYDNLDYVSPTLLDVVGTNDGTAIGLPASNQLGVVGEAFDFDGLTSRIDFANVLNAGTGALTIGTAFSWGGNGTSPGGFNSMIRKGLDAAGTPAGAGYQLAGRRADQRLYAEINDGTDFATISGSATLVTGASYHGLMVVDRLNQQMKLFEDGVLINTATISTVGSINTDLNFQLAALTREPAASTFESFHDGRLDESFVSVGTALTNAQALSVANQIVPVVPPPVLYLSFDNSDTSGVTLIDRTRRGNDGTLNGSLVTGVAGAINQAYTFDGVDDYLDHGFVSDINYDTTDAFSIAFWMNTSSNNQSVISNNNENVSPGWEVGVRPSGTLVLGLWNAGKTATRRTETSASFDDGNLHFCVVTYDGSNDANGINWYVDGVTEAKTIVTNTDPGSITNTEPLIVAGQRVNSSPTFLFTGLLDEMKVFSSELSASQVQWLYSQNLKGRQVLS